MTGQQVVPGDATRPLGERVLVTLSGSRHGQRLIERASVLAGPHGTLLAVHVAGDRDPAGFEAAEALRMLVDAAGGSWHTVLGDDAGVAVRRFAEEQSVSQIVVGGSGRGLALRLSRRGWETHHVPRPGGVRRDWRQSGSNGHLFALSPRRQALGFVLGALVLGLGTPVLVALRAPGSFGNALLLYLLGVVVVALAGGVWPALATAVLASFAADWWLVPPLHRLVVGDTQASVALAVFVAVALLVSAVVSLAARRSRDAARAGAEAETLSALAGSVLRGEQALPALLTRVRESFGGRSARLLRETDGRWSLVAESEDGAAPAVPTMATTTVPLGDRLRLELDSPDLDAADQRLLVAFAAHAAVVLEQRRIAEVESRSARTAEVDRVRTALLGAVSHDLRTPLAAAKTAVNGLLDTEVDWRADQRRDLLGTADESLDALARLVDDLLDMSRLQSGVLPVQLETTFLDDVVAQALRAVPSGRDVGLAVGPDLPPATADPVLLERVLANLLQNALRHAPGGPPPLIAAAQRDDHIEISVVDSGPGIAPDRLHEAFAPFQRLGDRPVRDADGGNAGVGLGLAIARGLTEAMGGELVASQTPGGGLTMTVRLPLAPVMGRMAP